jgi:acetamidase/formamidase
VVYAETVTDLAGDAPDLMMDDGIEEIFAHVPEVTRAPGPHILTGPIYVEGAEPGDMLQVEILSMTPRMPYASNPGINSGILYKELGEKDRVTIYEMDSDRQWLTAKFAYEYPGKYDTTGRIIAPDSVDRVPALLQMQVPVRLHLGNMGVAPAESGRISSVPPGQHGGNIDNWRLGPGTTMYYPVLVKGALLSLGDPHFAQGDGELSGSAVEGSLNCLIRLSVNKDFHFSSPLLETQVSWITHAFDPDLNAAAYAASLEMLKFLQIHYGLSKEDAYSYMSGAADLSITQIVDEKRGVHVSVPKSGARRMNR